MKKTILIIFVLLFLSSCSVQEKMNSEMFIERFSKSGAELDFQNAEGFYNDEKYLCYIKNANGTELLIELFEDEESNISKITLACSDIKAQAEFISCAKHIIETFSFDDSADSVLKEICKDGKINNEFSYYETQWYYYSTASTENILFFSIENKKLSPPKNTEFTLKPNDIDITKGSE